MCVRMLFTLNRCLHSSNIFPAQPASVPMPPPKETSSVLTSHTTEIHILQIQVIRPRYIERNECRGWNISNKKNRHTRQCAWKKEKKKNIKKKPDKKERKKWKDNKKGTQGGGIPKKTTRPHVLERIKTARQTRKLSKTY